jgi:hypothetical protein
MIIVMHFGSYLILVAFFQKCLDFARLVVAQSKTCFHSKRFLQDIADCHSCDIAPAFSSPKQDYHVIHRLRIQIEKENRCHSVYALDDSP